MPGVCRLYFRHFKVLVLMNFGLAVFLSIILLRAFFAAASFSVSGACLSQFKLQHVRLGCEVLAHEGPN